MQAYKDNQLLLEHNTRRARYKGGSPIRQVRAHREGHTYVDIPICIREWMLGEREVQRV